MNRRGKGSSIDLATGVQKYVPRRLEYAKRCASSDAKTIYISVTVFTAQTPSYDTVQKYFGWGTKRSYQRKDLTPKVIYLKVEFIRGILLILPSCDYFAILCNYVVKGSFSKRSFYQK